MLVWEQAHAGFVSLCRCLRTLLLENNQLTSLPPQLGKNRAYNHRRGVSRPLPTAMACFLAGRLHHLSGLSLSQNPLECPPQHVVMDGTKVPQRGFPCVHVLSILWYSSSLNISYGRRQCCTILGSSSKGRRGRKVS